MPKKIELKTKKTANNVNAFIDAIEDKEQRADAKRLLTLFKQLTGKKPKMWGTSIVGFGAYEYHRKNGDVGEFMATGFSPRKNALSLYIMPGYQNYQPLMKKLGKHTTGKSCLYIKRLADVDEHILATLITKGLADLKKTHTVY